MAHALAHAIIAHAMGIPLRMPFACHSHAIQWHAQAAHAIAHAMGHAMGHAIGYVMGPIRLIFELLIIYRVTEPADSKYYLLIGPCPDP